MEASKCDVFLTVVGTSITIFRKLPRRRKPTSEMGQALEFWVQVPSSLSDSRKSCICSLTAIREASNIFKNIHAKLTHNRVKRKQILGYFIYKTLGKKCKNTNKKAKNSRIWDSLLEHKALITISDLDPEPRPLEGNHQQIPHNDWMILEYLVYFQ